MNPATEPAWMRPLSLGELFDRAVTLYVRNFVLFTLIALVLIVPVAILQYFSGLHDSEALAQMLATIQHPGTIPPAQNGSDTALTFGFIATAFVLNAVVLVVISAALGALYRGERPEWSACYARALRRAGAIAAALLCECAVFALVIFAGAFAIVATFFFAALLVRESAPLGLIAFAAAAVVVLLWFAAMLLVYVAFAFAYNAIGMEEASAGSAIARGFSRIFNRSELLRALVMCLALIAIYAGLSVVSMAMASVLETLKLHLLYVVVSALVSLVATSFLGILFAVYYFDVRIRREGLDMQADVERLQPLAARS